MWLHFTTIVLKGLDWGVEGVRYLKLVETLGVRCFNTAWRRSSDSPCPCALA